MSQNIPRINFLFRIIYNTALYSIVAFTARPLPWCLDLLINHMDTLKLGQNFSDYTALQQFMTGFA
jgi:hypothetical protein